MKLDAGTRVLATAHTQTHLHANDLQVLLAYPIFFAAGQAMGTTMGMLKTRAA